MFIFVVETSRCVAEWITTLWIGIKTRCSRNACWLNWTCIWFLVDSVKSLPTRTLNRQRQFRVVILVGSLHKSNVLSPQSISSVQSWVQVTLRFFLLVCCKRLWLHLVLNYTGWLVTSFSVDWLFIHNLRTFLELLAV